jgi:hypothetical protein
MHLLLLRSAREYLCDNDSLQYSLEEQTEMDRKEGGWRCVKFFKFGYGLGSVIHCCKHQYIFVFYKQGGIS